MRPFVALFQLWKRAAQEKKRSGSAVGLRASEEGRIPIETRGVAKLTQGQSHLSEAKWDNPLPHPRSCTTPHRAAAQSVACCLRASLGSAVTYKAGVVAYTCNPSTWDEEAGWSGVQGQPQIHYEFKVNSGCTSQKVRGEKAVSTLLNVTREAGIFRKSHKRGPASALP